MMGRGVTVVVAAVEIVLVCVIVACKCQQILLSRHLEGTPSEHTEAVVNRVGVVVDKTVVVDVGTPDK